MVIKKIFGENFNFNKNIDIKKIFKLDKNVKKDREENESYLDALKEIYEEIKNLEIYEKMTIGMAEIIIGYDNVEKTKSILLLSQF